jgi:hypothetical protein
MEPEDHCPVRKSLPLASVLIQLNPVHTDTLVYMIHFIWFGSTFCCVMSVG